MQERHMNIKETKHKLTLQNMTGSSHHYTEVLIYLSCRFSVVGTDNTHSFRFTILSNSVVDAVVLYLAAEVHTSAELWLGMSLCVCNALMYWSGV